MDFIRKKGTGEVYLAQCIEERNEDGKWESYHRLYDVSRYDEEELYEDWLDIVDDIWEDWEHCNKEEIQTIIAEVEKQRILKRFDL